MGAPPYLDTARRLLGKTTEAFGARALEVVERMEGEFEDAMAAMTLSEAAGHD